MSIKRAATSSVTKSGSAISDVPDAPTGLSATDSGDGTTASVSFTAAATGGGSITSYTVTSSPGGFTGTGASSPISVTGLTAGTAYTFTVTATNSSGTSGASSASSSLTLASVGSYFLIQRTTVGAGGSSSITFSSIPSTYKHLQIRCLAQTNRSGANYGDGINLRFNSDSGSNYSLHELYGTGASAGAYGGASQTSISMYAISTAYSDANRFGVSIIDILDYATTNKNKTVRNLSGLDYNGGGQITMNSGAWFSTSAVTTITLIPDGGTSFNQYSSFALYGIK